MSRAFGTDGGIRTGSAGKDCEVVLTGLDENVDGVVKDQEARPHRRLRTKLGLDDSVIETVFDELANEIADKPPAGRHHVRVVDASWARNAEWRPSIPE